VVQSRYPEAATALKRSIDIREAVFGSNSKWLITGLEAYSRLMRKMQDYAEAEKADVRALGIQVRNSLHP
jgi:hypothetical protein